METYGEDQFQEVGLPVSFAQDNHWYSRKGVVRGLHFQWGPPMGKLMRVTRGAAFLVAVDLRLGAAALGKWVGGEAAAEDPKQGWAPARFAGGICALQGEVGGEYKGHGTSHGEGGAAIWTA